MLRGGAGGNDTERALWLMFGVNSLLTGTQIFCGAIANSLSLLGDGALMAMDGVSYAVSLYAEKKKASAQDAKRLDRAAAFFSAAMLAATTVWVLFDVIERLTGQERESALQVGSMGSQLHDIQVNSEIMIAFTSLNLAADFVVVLCTWSCGASKLMEEEASNLNLFGALAHLGADVVRGFAVLLAGILAEVGLVQASMADAYCSLFVCIFVLAATASLLKTLLRRSNPLAYAQMEGEGEAGTHPGQEPATEASLTPTVLGARCDEPKPPTLPDGI